MSFIALLWGTVTPFPLQVDTGPAGAHLGLPVLGPGQLWPPRPRCLCAVRVPILVYGKDGSVQ